MELPTISKHATVNSTYAANDLLVGQGRGDRAFHEDVQLSHFPSSVDAKLADDFLARQARGLAVARAAAAIQPKKVPPMSRIVRVFITDSNENLPLDKRILYTGPEQHTDLTDQELFFEANPAALLTKHNEYRTTVMDKRLSNPQREVKLEPARIRDLKMVVVDVAVF